MKIQQFNGGQSSRLRPQYIGQNEAVSYINIDNAVGSLAPVKDKLLTAVEVKKYHKFFNAEQIWVDSDVPTDFLEFQQTMYAVDGVQPTKTKDGVTLNLGITAPISAPNTINANAVATITDFSAVNLVSDLGTYGDLPISDLRYRLVNVKAGRYSKVLQFTVKYSTSSAVKVTSSILDKISLVGLLFTPAVEDPTPIFDRSVQFSDLKGITADAVIFFRYYKGVWRKAFTMSTPDVGPVQAFLDDVEDISANEEFDNDLVGDFDGTYQYVYTYYNEDDGTESAPSPVSSELVALSGTVELTGMSVSPDSQVTHKRIYRVGNNIATFTMVAQISGELTTYSDSLSDTEVDGRLLESDNFSAAPASLRFLAESYAMMFGAVGNSLRFTPIGKPNAWPPEYSIAFEDNITGIGPVANGVIVCTGFKTYLVTGTGPLSLSQQSLSGDQGCVAHSSIQEVGPSLIWASAEGLCLTSGNSVTNITKDKLGRIKLNPVDSALDDEVYYCHDEDGTTLAWDFRFGNIPKYLALDISRVSIANSELYGWQDNLMYKLFQSDDNLSLTYLSPRFVEGTITELKSYKKFHIYVKGDIIINILINDVIVFTKELTGESDYQLQVPQTKQRGNFVQFSITGTGEVYEYEYEAGREHSG